MVVSTDTNFRINFRTFPKVRRENEDTKNGNIAANLDYLMSSNKL